MSVNPSPLGGFATQFFDNNGVILSGGKIYTYTAGTTTPQVTYTSASGLTPHANPIILDSAGRVPGGEIWLTDSLIYKFLIETSTGGLIGSYDNIFGINADFSATVVLNIATLRAATWPFGVPEVVQLVNNYFPGDSGGSFRYDATDTTTADNGVTVIVGTNQNRWTRQYTGNIDARWAGCVGDSTATVAGTDNLVAFARLNALGVVVVDFPATPTNYYYTTGFFTDIVFRTTGRGQIRTAGGNILPPTYTRIRTPTSFGSANQNLFDGDLEFVNGAYYAWDNRTPSVNAQYFNKNLIPNYSFSEHAINSGSSGVIAFTTAAILVSDTSVTVTTTTGLSIGMTVGFGQSLTFATSVTITNIVGSTVFWSGAIGVAYPSGVAISDSPRTMGVTTMWNTASEAYGDTYCNVMRISSSTSTVLPGQKNIFETRTLGLTGGDVVLVGSYAYGTGVELIITEGASGVGNGACALPIFFVRQSSDTTRGAFWIGTFLNSGGPVACDAAMSVANKWKAGLCTVLANNADLQAAVQTAKGQKIAFNATATATADLSLWGNVPGTTYISQRTSDDAFETYVNGVLASEITVTGTNRDISFPASTFVFVRQNTTTAALTGDGTEVDLGFDTEVVDVGNLYTSPTFTTSVTGSFLITLNVTMGGLTSGNTTSRLSLLRSDGVTVARSVINPYALLSGDAVVTQTLTAIVPMTGGQSIKPRWNVLGGSLSVTMIGGASIYDSYMNISKVR